jgi:putative ABC transport system permease protein
MGSFISDAVHALRALRKSPGFAITAILTLALGTGATTAIFSVVNAVLLEPLPYAGPDRLVRVISDMRNRNVNDFPIAPGDFHDLRARISSFEAIAAFTTGRNVIPGPGGRGDAEQIRTGNATPSLFRLLGARMAAGRDFEEADGTPLPAAPPPGAPAAAGPPPAPPPPPAAILSYEFWQRRFGGDPQIVGRVVDLGGPRFFVKGVLAPGFEMLLSPSTNTETAPDIWTATRQNFATASRINVAFRVLGRLRPGASIDQAQAELEALAADLRQQFPIKQTAGVYFRAVPMADDLVAEVRPGVLTLMGAVVFVLLIACANVANLLLVRSAARERELAVRTALGGSRSRIMLQMLTENLTLAAIGAIGGLMLARLGIRLLVYLAPENLPRLRHIEIDPVVLGFTALAAALSAIIFGLVPALRASRPDVIDALRRSSRTSGLGQAGWIRSAVVITEVALSFVLLVGAGLMIRSFIALQRTDPGFDPNGVLTFQIPNTRRQSPEASQAFARDLRQRFLALPGVSHVTAATVLPQDGGNSLVRWGPVEALNDPSKFQQAILHVVLPGYFDAMKTRVVDGRGITDADNVTSNLNIVIDNVLAAKAFPGQSAVGKTLYVRARSDQPEALQIVGVVEHQRHTALKTTGREAIFAPDSFFGFGATGRWAIRTTGNPLDLVPLVRAQVAEMDPRVGVVAFQPYTAFLERAQAPTKFALVLIGVFAGVAAVLAAIGLYGVLSTLVRQRTAEIGVRMAFGAARGRIFRMMVGQGLRLSAIGLGLGVLGAFWLTGTMRSLLVGVQPTDPATFAAMSGLFLMVAAVSAGIPAIRAARLEPIAALREE